MRHCFATHLLEVFAAAGFLAMELITILNNIVFFPPYKPPSVRKPFLSRTLRVGPTETHVHLFNQGISGQPGTLVRFLTDIHPARSVRDIENYLARLTPVAPALDQGIAESRERATRGIVPPRFILAATHRSSREAGSTLGLRQRADGNLYAQPFSYPLIGNPTATTRGRTHEFQLGSR
jgi:hypothetical protein